MANLSDISVVNIFKGIILDSLTRDGFIRKPPQSQSLESFFSKNKSLLFTSAAVAAGAALGPVAIGGAVTALGFGQAGITAGSIAAWMMSLHRGAVAAGSLVAILQSIGAAGLSIGGIIAAGVGGGFFAGAIAKSLQNILESNPEGLAELENFVSVTCENDSTGSRTKVIFDLKHQLLVSGENEKLKSFFKGFHLAQQIAKTRVRQFEFKVISDDEKCVEGSNFLHNNLIDTYGIDHVISKYRNYLLTYMLNNALFKAIISMALRPTTFISLMTSRSSFIVTLK